MIKLIFLDFDGVLNTPKTWGKFYIGDGSDAIDAERVALVNRIVNETGAKVVISSTWRRDKTIPELNTLLAKKGATFNVWGVTPHRSKLARRGEIMEFVATMSRSYEIGKIVVIDDDSDASIAGAFVQTNLDNEDGLTVELANDAIRILNAI